MSARRFEFEGVVRLTGLGGAYLLLAVLVGIAAINTGNNSLYIALSGMLGILIASGIASKDGLRRIGVEVTYLSEAWAGKPARATLRICNRSRLWSVRDLIVTGPHLAEPLLVPIIEPGASIEISVPVLFHRRGKVQLARADLYTRFPFGLFSKKRRVKLSGDALVFPRLLDDAPVALQFAPAIGDRTVRNVAGYGTEIFGFREYVRGDSLRHVHWKKSASIGRWVMKQSQQDTNPFVAITFDPMLPSGTEREEFETIVSAAATYIRDAITEGYDVRFHLGRGVHLVSRADRGIAAFEALALVQPAAEAPAPHSGPGVVVFSLRSRVHESRTA